MTAGSVIAEVGVTGYEAYAAMGRASAGAAVAAISTAEASEE